MFQLDNFQKIGNIKDMERHAYRFVKLFFEKTGNPYSPKIQLYFENKRSPADHNVDLFKSIVVSTIWTDNDLSIRIYSPDLIGFPLPVLQGALDQELAIFLLSMEHQAFKLNFEKQILPQFSVNGSALQIMRRLVFHLETGLKRYQATRLLAEIGHGSSQFLYYYFLLTPMEDNKQHYRKLVPHHWMRALFLSRMAEHYMPLTLLDRQENMVGMIPYWWCCYDHVHAEDRQLLEKITTIAGKETRDTFAHRIVDMFNIINTHLLNTHQP